ncbi:MAG: hypothetical protein WBC88_05410 [Candidatus Zixiibacteriota bacterium]
MTICYDQRGSGLHLKRSPGYNPATDGVLIATIGFIKKKRAGL